VILGIDHFRLDLLIQVRQSEPVETNSVSHYQRSCLMNPEEFKLALQARIKGIALTSNKLIGQFE